ncbi:MAG: hypothetical protein AAFU58_08360, partial [Pseudomonadota bacterium]
PALPRGLSDAKTPADILVAAIKAHAASADTVSAQDMGADVNDTPTRAAKQAPQGTTAHHAGPLGTAAPA